jgi:hypothetical protein
MKHKSSFLLFYLLLFYSCLSQGRDSSDMKAIDFVLKTYTDAIQKGQGRVAIKYISRNTIDYYDTLIFHALYSDEEELKKINILTRTAILRMRHTKPVSYWDTMSARKLMEQLWSSTSPNQTNNQVGLNDCKIDQFTATCILTLNGKPTEMVSVFNKENNEWKIDITSTNEVGIKRMQEDIKRRNISETDYIILTLEKLENVRIDNEKLYIPLKEK